MTVLAKYQRLEAEAIWRPDPHDQRRDVIVSIGDATLTIAAPNGTALSHWSLPAILRLNPGQQPAAYAPGEDSPEMLELTDEEMIGALEAVLKSVRSGVPRNGSLRSLTVAGIGIALVLAGLYLLPGAITRYAASLVPDGARSEIGTRLRVEVRRLTGAPCAAPSGLRALEKLQTRLFPDGTSRLVVLPSALAETAHLPDGTILIGHKLVEDFETPDVLAGYLLAEDVRRRQTDPLERLLEDGGLRSALALLTTGRVDDDALQRHAERLVAATPTPVADAPLIERLDQAEVSGTAYAYALDFSGETTVSLIDAGQTETSPVLIDDGDWIALQRICEG